MIGVTQGDMREVLAAWAAEGRLFDACVTDPPYHLTSIVRRFGGEGAAPAQRGKGKGATGAFERSSRGFMGKTWDGGDVALQADTWRRVYEVMKPGAHMIAFSGTRTVHRMVCAIEDAGFEIRDGILDMFEAEPMAATFMDTLDADQREQFARLLDQSQFTGLLAWIYGSGFPKSHDVAKGLKRRASGGCAKAESDKADWQGWGTALKPCFEPICLARKPLSEKSIAANVLKWGTGAINVDACRVGTDGPSPSAAMRANGKAPASCKPGEYGDTITNRITPERWLEERPGEQLGRWPGNVVHDGSADAVAGFPDAGGGFGKRGASPNWGPSFTGGATMETVGFGDSGSASRFFYSPKAGPLDRMGTAHATVKPVDLMRWLVRMVCPPGGVVLDPFAGSGKTGIAALAEGFDCEMIDLEAEHVADIERQLAFLRGEGGRREVEMHKARLDRAGASVPDLGPLFAGGGA